MSFIEFSGYFAKYTLASLNLYLNEDEFFSRILQSGGGIETAGQNPIHPLVINKDKIISLKNEYDKIPEQYKKHLEKGIHYKFLGFYDESFLCFYKLVESLFYSEHFFNVISIEKEDSIKKELSALRKNHSQKK